MITENVKRFIELQNQVNNQIDQYGEADIQLVDELESLGDQLTGDEISVLCTYMEEDVVEDIEYEDVEWMIE